ncbi:uncharacterized protein, partial [Dendropsophus ebraccatus]|uniref:uncharacterized protein n=1 Tax=Dendropsophus ebraccatus TaxID=150705 RepID=UPI003831E29E
GDHFIDQHREELIDKINIIWPVISDLYSNKLLTGEEQDYIMETPESEDRMRRLYDIMKCYEDDEKEKVYDALYKYNPRVIGFLVIQRDSSSLDKTGDHFIDRHREELIGRIKNVEPVIDDLYSNNLLTREERDYIMEIPAPYLMIKRLYNIMKCYDEKEKGMVYDALYKYNSMDFHGFHSFPIMQRHCSQTGLLQLLVLQCHILGRVGTSRRDMTMREKRDNGKCERAVNPVLHGHWDG